VLELGDAELELLDSLARGDAELRREARRGIARRLAEAVRFPLPALEDVDEGSADLPPVDPESAGELLAELVHALDREHERSDPGEAEALERAARRASALAHAASRLAAAAVVPVSRRPT
jgi:hypothetical protein